MPWWASSRPSAATSRSSSPSPPTSLPIQQAAIFSKVSGYIRKIHVDRGDFVEGRTAPGGDRRPGAQGLGGAGARRARLVRRQVSRSPGPRSRGRRPTSRTSARTSPRRAPSLANDTRQAERMKTLFEKGMVAAVDWDNARTTADSSRASTDAAEAQLRLAEVQITTQESQVRLAQAQVETYRAALSLAQSNLSNTRLLAPFAGYIAQRNLDQGAAVSAAVRRHHHHVGRHSAHPGHLQREGPDRGAGARHRPRGRGQLRARDGRSVQGRGLRGLRRARRPQPGPALPHHGHRGRDPQPRRPAQARHVRARGRRRGDAQGRADRAAGVAARGRRAAARDGRQERRGRAGPGPARAPPTHRPSRSSRASTRATRSSSRARTSCGRVRRSAPSRPAAASSPCG